MSDSREVTRAYARFLAERFLAHTDALREAFNAGYEAGHGAGLETEARASGAWRGAP